VASTALQSPFSWTWKPKRPLAGSPPTWPATCTPPGRGVRVSVPLTRLPEAEARATLASAAVLTVAGWAGAAGAVATGAVVVQAASSNRLPAPRQAETVRIIGILPGVAGPARIPTGPASGA